MSLLKQYIKLIIKEASIEISPIPSYTNDQVLEILSVTDLSAGQGKCGEIAIAINEVLFAGAGEYIAAANKFLWQHGIFVGHVAVRIGSDVWDAEGIWENDPAPEEFLAWGILDPEDPEYVFDNENDAYEVELLESLSENDIRAMLPGTCSEENIRQRIESAIAEVAQILKEAPIRDFETIGRPLDKKGGDMYIYSSDIESRIINVLESCVGKTFLM